MNIYLFLNQLFVHFLRILILKFKGFIWIINNGMAWVADFGHTKNE